VPLPVRGNYTVTILERALPASMCRQFCSAACWKVATMPARVIHGLEEFRSLVGQPLGTSDWYDVTQERVNAFAAATGDHQWIHTDPERAARESPYKTTIAHGFFSLALTIMLAEQAFRLEGVKMVVNYGLNRVRFPSSVPVGSRLRMNVQLVSITDAAQGVQVVLKETFEVEGQPRPACVAEQVLRLFF
jgi:acyl dehydratase